MRADKIFVMLLLILMLMVWIFAAAMSVGASLVPNRVSAWALPPKVLQTAALEDARLEDARKEALKTPAVRLSRITDEWQPDQADVDMLAKLLWGEARGVNSRTKQAAVVWCVLNRVDRPGCWGDTIADVVLARGQFVGYNQNNPVLPELAELAADVLCRHHAEAEGQKDVGRVLPKEYCYFVGKDGENLFTAEWRGRDYWCWSLDSPYDSQEAG